MSCYIQIQICILRKGEAEQGQNPFAVLRRITRRRTGKAMSHITVNSRRSSSSRQRRLLRRRPRPLLPLQPRCPRPTGVSHRVSSASSTRRRRPPYSPRPPPPEIGPRKPRKKVRLRRKLGAYSASFCFSAFCLLSFEI